MYLTPPSYTVNMIAPDGALLTTRVNALRVSADHPASATVFRQTAGIDGNGSAAVAYTFVCIRTLMTSNGVASAAVRPPPRPPASRCVSVVYSPSGVRSSVRRVASYTPK